jgi:hypothetical protein
MVTGTTLIEEAHAERDRALSLRGQASIVIEESATLVDLSQQCLNSSPLQLVISIRTEDRICREGQSRRPQSERTPAPGIGR